MPAEPTKIELSLEDDSVVEIIDGVFAYGMDLMHDVDCLISNTYGIKDLILDLVNESTIFQQDPQLKLNFQRSLYILLRFYQDFLGLETSQDRWLKTAGVGRIYFLISRLYEFKTKYFQQLTTGNFQVDFCVQALAEITELERLVRESTGDFSLRADQTIETMLRVVPQVLSMEHVGMQSLYDTAVEIESNKLSLLGYSFRLIGHLKKKLVQAALQCVDESVRSRGKSIPNDAASLDKVLAELGAESLHKYCSNIYAVYKSRVTTFGLISSLKQRIDQNSLQKTTTDGVETTTLTAICLRNICQLLDKALYFNPGMCYGGARVLLRQKLRVDQFIQLPTPKYATYSDLHDLKIDNEIYAAHNSQHSAFARASKGSIAVVLDLIKCERKHPAVHVFANVLEFVQDWLAKIRANSQNQLVQGFNVGPQMLLALIKPNAAHALAMQICQLSDKQLYLRLIDLNAGEYLIRLDSSEFWLAHYFIALKYADYDSYRITIDYDKPNLDPILNAGFPAYRKANEDRQTRSRLASMMKSASKGISDKQQFYEQYLANYAAIHDKDSYDHFALMHAATNLIDVCDTDYPTEFAIAKAFIDYAITVLDAHSDQDAELAEYYHSYKFFLGCVAAWANYFLMNSKEEFLAYVRQTLEKYKALEDVDADICREIESCIAELSENSGSWPLIARTYSATSEAANQILTSITEKLTAEGKIEVLDLVYMNSDNVYHKYLLPEAMPSVDMLVPVSKLVRPVHIEPRFQLPVLYMFNPVVNRNLSPTSTELAIRPRYKALC